MSSRQIARLQNKNLLNARLTDVINNDDVEADEEDTHIPVKKSVFSSVLLSLSSSSSSSSSSESDFSVDKTCEDEIDAKEVNFKKEIVPEKANRPYPTRKPNKNNDDHSKSITIDSEVDADLEYLNSLIASKDVKSISTKEISSLAFQDRYNLCFEVDERNLDMDNILRKRFGRSFTQWEHFEHNPNVIQNRPPNTQTKRGGSGLKRRGIFCEKKEDWVKPPAFIDGGMAVEKVLYCTSSTYISLNTKISTQVPGSGMTSSRSPIQVNHFTLRWSKDYALLSQKFERLVAGSGDANRCGVVMAAHKEIVVLFCYKLIIIAQKIGSSQFFNSMIKLYGIIGVDTGWRSSCGSGLSSWKGCYSSRDCMPSWGGLIKPW